LPIYILYIVLGNVFLAYPLTSMQ
jgi:hypothetical protein